MANVKLVSKVKSPFTMILADFPFTFNLPQGAGAAEYKQEFKPYYWKVDIWTPNILISFIPDDLRMYLYVVTSADQSWHIEVGYAYRFELEKEEPEPVPVPQPTPQPPIPEPTPTPVTQQKLVILWPLGLTAILKVDVPYIVIPLKPATLEEFLKKVQDETLGKA